MDPCSVDAAEHPEQYFDYDEYTGQNSSKKWYSGVARRRALDTINDLGLNKLDIMFYRLDWTRSFISDLLALPVSERQAYIEFFTTGLVEYGGVTGMVVPLLIRDGCI